MFGSVVSILLWELRRFEGTCNNWGLFIIDVYKKPSSVLHKLNLLCNWPVFDTMCMQALLLVFHGYILPPSLGWKWAGCLCICKFWSNRHRRWKGVQRRSYHMALFKAMNSCGVSPKWSLIMLLLVMPKDLNERLVPVSSDKALVTTLPIVGVLDPKK
jgi:hypothetical protein